MGVRERVDKRGRKGMLVGKEGNRGEGCVEAKIYPLPFLFFSFASPSLLHCI